MKGPIVLIGLMGSGKTKVGQALAKALGWEWVDLDAALVAKHRASIADQFKHDGEAKFRDRESALLKAQARGARLVLSTGGGVVLRPENRVLLKRQVTVYLQASPQALAKRLKGPEVQRRPLLHGQKPEKVLRRLLRLRGGFYRASASLVVRASQGKPEAVASRILARLNELY